MAQRITVKNVRAMWRSYAAACRRLGFDTAGWGLHEGSSTYGRAYRAFTADGKSAPGTAWNGYLGSTAKEAYAALEHAQSALWAVADLRNKES